ncbi:MAG: InlB B-repeat-containing protein [Treponema sp.]|nr:InlB B-repeat-containing protein [Treponema sp.]
MKKNQSRFAALMAIMVIGAVLIFAGSCEALGDHGFIIIYDGNGSTGGTGPDSVLARIGEDITLADNTFTRPGHGFLGWNTQANGLGRSFNAGQVVSDLAAAGETIILFAQWRPGYTVAFHANGGDGTMAPASFITGRAHTLPNSTFTRAGYAFASWNTEADGDGTTFTANQSVTNLALTGETFNLYAQWRETYTVTFHANGGEGTMAPLTFLRDTAHNMPFSTFTRTGYTFTSWNTQADGGGTAFTAGQSVTNLAAAGGNFNLYAQWVEGVPQVGKILILQANTFGNTNHNSGSGLHKSAVELFNNNDFPVDLTGGNFFLHIGTATAWTYSIKLEGIIPANSSFLVVSNDPGEVNAGTYALFPTPDQEYNFTIANEDFKVAVLRNMPTLSVLNPFTVYGPYTDGGNYIDMLGIGSAAAEGTSFPSGDRSRPRVPRRNSLTDTDNNAADFTDVDYRNANWANVTSVLYRYWPRNSAMGAWNPMTGLPRMDPVLRIP